MTRIQPRASTITNGHVERARRLLPPAPRPLPVLRARALLPARTEVEQALYEEYRDTEARRSRNARRDGYSNGNRCRGCRRFVRGVDVQCSHCGAWGPHSSTR